MKHRAISEEQRQRWAIEASHIGDASMAERIASGGYRPVTTETVARWRRKYVANERTDVARTGAATPVGNSKSSNHECDIDCTGDVVAGDIIEFVETVWGGSHRKPTKKGERTIKAEVLKDSYGAEKQQHTFTLRILQSSGTESLKPNETVRRKGRNIYRNGTKRAAWRNEPDRIMVAEEKHGRGDQARKARAARKTF